MNTAARLAVVHTVGIAKEGLTAEDIAEQLDTVLDVTGARVTDCRPMHEQHEPS
jgi:hypothetical protein